MATRSRRCSPHHTMLLLLLLLPRVVIAGTIDDTAVALCVWSAMVLTLTLPRSRIPRAIIYRPVGVRLRRTLDVLLERLGDLPMSYGTRASLPLPPGAFATLRSAEPLDPNLTGSCRSIVGTLRAPESC